MEEGIKQDKEFLEVMVDDMGHRIMGKALDTMRTSEMSDRALKQAERTMKDFTNELIIKVIETLKDKGYLK